MGLTITTVSLFNSGSYCVDVIRRHSYKALSGIAVVSMSIYL